MSVGTAWELGKLGNDDRAHSCCRFSLVQKNDILGTSWIHWLSIPTVWRTPERKLLKFWGSPLSPSIAWLNGVCFDLLGQLAGLSTPSGNWNAFSGKPRMSWNGEGHLHQGIRSSLLVSSQGSLEGCGSNKGSFARRVSLLVRHLYHRPPIVHRKGNGTEWSFRPHPR